MFHGENGRMTDKKKRTEEAMTLVCIVLGLLALFFGIVYAVYRICFGEYRQDKDGTLESLMPVGKEYIGYEEVIMRGIKRVWDAPYEAVEITSHDGLKLRGRYYHRTDGAPVVLMMHGYHGNIFRDGNGIFSFSEKYGFNLLMPDQRAQGISEGKAITFGIKERLDCKSWVEYLTERFGAEQKIMLCGLSMGAATVLMAADVGLSDNVTGIMADCGFSSPKEILCSVMKSLKLPVKVVYLMAKLGARLFGGVNLEEASAVESVKKCKIPVLLLHGEADTFVPCYMSRMCHEACASEVELLTVPGAGHGMSYCLDAAAYEEAVDRLFVKAFGKDAIT